MLVTLIAAAVALSGLGGFNAWRLLGIPEAPATARNPAAPGAVAAGPSAPVSGSAPALPGASVPATEGIRQVTASGGGPAGTAAAGQAAGTVRPGVSVGVSAGPGRAGGGAAVAFGPWRCGDAYSWELGHPVLARPCHALGPAVRVSGEMEAPPGVQADVSLTVRDAVTDEVAAGPYVCRGLMFTDFALKQTCGPTDLSPPRGGRYVVAESWQYTERPLLPGGSARGPAFDW
jgi:serine/threonine-protein kinase